MGEEREIMEIGKSTKVNGRAHKYPVLHKNIQEAPIHVTLLTYFKSSVLGAISIFSKESHQSQEFT